MSKVKKQKVANAAGKKPRKDAADGAAAGKTLKKGGAAVFVHHTRRPPEGKQRTDAEDAKDLTGYARKTLALCLSVLRLAEKRMDAGLERLEANGATGRDVEKAERSARAIYALCGAAEHVKGMM